KQSNSLTAATNVVQAECVNNKLKNNNYFFSFEITKNWSNLSFFQFGTLLKEHFLRDKRFKKIRKKKYSYFSASSASLRIFSNEKGMNS
ncbi:hypothetical protein BpHYR1_048644, partial [Brachionus plicatilis]